MDVDLTAFAGQVTRLELAGGVDTSTWTTLSGNYWAQIALVDKP